MALIDHELIEHLAWLARIELTQDENKKFIKQLEDILGYVSIVDALQGKGAARVGETMGQGTLVNGLQDNLRDNKARVCLPPEVTLRNAPAKQKGYFKVKAVLE